MERLAVYSPRFESKYEIRAGLTPATPLSYAILHGEVHMHLTRRE